MKEIKGKALPCPLLNTKVCPHPEKCNGIRRVCGFWQHCHGKFIIGSRSQRNSHKYET